MSRRTVLALATGPLVLGVLAAPAVAAPVEPGSERICVLTRFDPETGERDGICVWFPDVVPQVPAGR